jgi:hypothetical protein
MEECKLCGNEIKNTEDSWCYGCKAFICEDHPNNDVWGGHNPEDHDRNGEGD